MKATFTIEDTPKGIFPVLTWHGNGCSDHLADSIAMHLMADLAAKIQQCEKLGVLKVITEADASACRS